MADGDFTGALAKPDDYPPHPPRTGEGFYEGFSWFLDGWFLRGHSGRRHLGGGRGDGAPSLVLWKPKKGDLSVCEERLTPSDPEFIKRLYQQFSAVERKRIEAQR